MESIENVKLSLKDADLKFNLNKEPAPRPGWTQVQGFSDLHILLEWYASFICYLCQLLWVLSSMEVLTAFLEMRIQLHNGQCWWTVSLGSILIDFVLLWLKYHNSKQLTKEIIYFGSQLLRNESVMESGMAQVELHDRRPKNQRDHLSSIKQQVTRIKWDGALKLSSWCYFQEATPLKGSITSSKYHHQLSTKSSNTWVRRNFYHLNHHRHEKTLGLVRARTVWALETLQGLWCFCIDTMNHSFLFFLMCTCVYTCVCMHICVKNTDR